MPTAGDVERFLFKIAPKELAMSWDNVGLLVGETRKEVHSILVALDITDAVVDEAVKIGADLIVSHHPVMNCTWLPVQNVRDDTYQGKLLIQMLRHGVSGICMHTNLDIAEGGVNDQLAKVLGLKELEPLGNDGCGRIGHTEREVPFSEFTEYVYDALHCNGLRFVSSGKPAHRVAVGGGACWSYHEDVIAKGCDTFVTSDLGYHDFQDAKNQGLNVIDAGHFPTEDVICTPLVTLLKEEYPSLLVQKSSVHKEVFQYLKK